MFLLHLKPNAGLCHNSNKNQMQPVIQIAVWISQKSPIRTFPHSALDLQACQSVLLERVIVIK